MAHEFRLPDIGEGLTEAEVVRWLVPVGGPVEVDQPVVEVETDKAVVEIPSPFAGVVLRHGAEEGEVVEVGAVLVVIGEADQEDEAVDEPPVAEPAGSPPEAAPIVGSLSEEADELVAAPPRRPSAGTVKALPVVRKLARDMGVDLGNVHGTGPGGRVTREDVMAAASAPVEDASGTVARAAPPPARPGDERRQMSKLRRTIAANMARSWAEIPHVTTFDEVDGSRLLEVRRALENRHGVPVPLDALLVAAVMPALRAHPELNATLDGDDLIVHGRLDMGVAMDTPDGLMVAVVSEADRLGILDLASEILRLAEGARSRALRPEELTGQTFTVSNIGAVGGGFGTPIVPPGTIGILSVGRAVERPVARDGQIGIAPVIPLSLSYDHRVVDGGLGRRFMAMVLENLAEPALALAT